MNLPALGVGITYHEGLDPILESKNGLVDVVEIEPQTIWFDIKQRSDTYAVDNSALNHLKSLRFPKILHGVGFPIGGTRTSDPSQIPALLNMVSDLQVSWISEHLSFNEARRPNGNFKTGILLPPRQTLEGVTAAVNSIKSMAKYLPVPLAVETGVNYLRPRDDELSDGEFVRAVTETANCGLVLDLHNIWTNERNGRQSVEDFVSQIPLNRVWEVHMAGGSEVDGYWVDSHSDGMDERLIDLAGKVIPLLPNLRALIFEIFPSFLPVVGLDLIRSQLRILHQIWGLSANTGPTMYLQSKARNSLINDKISYNTPKPDEWEDVLGSLVVGQKVEGRLAGELAADPGIGLIRKLLASFRSSMIARTLKLTFRLLFLTLGEDSCMRLLEDYWKDYPPELFASSEAEGFVKYLSRRHLDVTYLSEISAFEEAIIASLIYRKHHVVKFRHDPVPIIRALAKGRLPEICREGDFEIEVTPDDPRSIIDMNVSLSH
jgi:uncharacterized protein (UPF0276 family)